MAPMKAITNMAMPQLKHILHTAEKNPLLLDLDAGINGSRLWVNGVAVMLESVNE